jgi:hypothetical protein
MSEPTNKPVHKIRIGSVQAAVWANEGPNGPWHNVTFIRSFKQDGEWKSSSSFNRDDLLVLARIATAAFDWVAANQKREPAE